MYFKVHRTRATQECGQILEKPCYTVNEVPLTNYYYYTIIIILLTNHCSFFPQWFQYQCLIGYKNVNFQEKSWEVRKALEREELKI